MFTFTQKVVAGSQISTISVSGLSELVNIERKESGLSELTLDSRLTSAAEKKAQDMLQNNYWAHQSPDGVQPWFFIEGSGYDYQYAGENLARGYTTNRGVVTGWMNSESHKKNILSVNYTNVGYAVVSGDMNGKPSIVVVQMFGTPRIAGFTEQSNRILIAQLRVISDIL
jgi:uncharacterized protein YkwD